MNEIEQLKTKIESEISVTEKRIERRMGPNFHDETARIHALIGRVDAYEKVLRFIGEFKNESSHHNQTHKNAR